MSHDNHYRSLENMYHAAPINEIYPPVIEVREGEATITVQMQKKYEHAAGGVHGSVYFKLLDDAAFFAANSLEHEVFVLTTSFTTYITRPLSGGHMRAEGKVVNKNRSQWIVEAVVYDDQDREIGRGNGIMVRSKVALQGIEAYKL
jgi:uncharacterized protein (TIGR00369 family)